MQSNNSPEKRTRSIFIIFVPFFTTINLFKSQIADFQVFRKKFRNIFSLNFKFDVLGQKRKNEEWSASMYPFWMQWNRKTARFIKTGNIAVELQRNIAYT